MGAKVYKCFIEVFAPAMLRVAEHRFSTGTFYEDGWVGLISSIPKVAGTRIITKLCPITLQAVKKKVADDYFVHLR